MLVLTRRIGEAIIINHEIKIIALDVRENEVRLGINAPRGISVNREEIQKRIDGGLTPKEHFSEDDLDDDYSDADVSRAELRSEYPEDYC